MKSSTKTPALPPRTALVLAGGGARGAYQVGVLSGLAGLGVLERERSGLDVFVGSSAGAINSAMLASHAGELADGIGKLRELWSAIRAQDVFRTDVRAIGGTGIKWAWDLTFGGAVGGVTPKSLLDTEPLREFLSTHIPFDRLDRQIESGALHALAVAATDLATADGIVFLHGQPEIELWRRRRWQIEKTKIGTEHVMASSAIPIFFPSVEVDGRHFGDGSVRNTAPLSPAINLGAERIIAISVREPSHARQREATTDAPTIAQIAGVLLDAVMLDAIEVDLDHSERVNRSVVSYRARKIASPFRHVDVLWVQPTTDFTALAAEFAHQIPAIVRYVMRGLGSEEAMTELTSYLLFDAEFCSRLIELGRADVENSADDILAFFAGEPFDKPGRAS